ncbi:hypothetical protein ACROYT_G021410 [Oculina patagonica]
MRPSQNPATTLSAIASTKFIESSRKLKMKTIIVFLVCFIAFSVNQSSAKRNNLRQCMAKCEQHPDIKLCEEFMCPGTYCDVCNEALRKCKKCCRRPSTTCVYIENPFA